MTRTYADLWSIATAALTESSRVNAEWESGPGQIRHGRSDFSRDEVDAWFKRQDTTQPYYKSLLMDWLTAGTK